MHGRLPPERHPRIRSRPATGITLAADELNVTAGAVSRQIKPGRSLGIPLFSGLTGRSPPGGRLPCRHKASRTCAMPRGDSSAPASEATAKVRAYTTLRVAG
jgi:hypothetical protein